MLGGTADYIVRIVGGAGSMEMCEFERIPITNWRTKMAGIFWRERNQHIKIIIVFSTVTIYFQALFTHRANSCSCFYTVLFNLTFI
jgi:hypothetical protein